MTTYSDAANEYAEALHGDGIDGEWYHARDNVRAFVRAAFDAGLAARPSPEPITTAAELRALPGRAVVVDQSGMAWQRNAEGEDDWYLGLRTTGETSEEIARYGPLTLLVPASAPAEPEPADDRTRGLYAKFAITRTDPAAQKRHEQCFNFVLDLDHDPFAMRALATYADQCRAEYPKLADDLDHALAFRGYTAPAEPERLTNPDDPRIRDGALLAFESSETDGTHFTMRKRVCDAKGATYTAKWHRSAIRGGSRVLLLEEAPEAPEPEPEPDADVLTVLAAKWNGSEDNARDMLSTVRAAGLDIVRVQP